MGMKRGGARRAGPEAALGRILEAMADDLMETTDEELLAGLREDGVDVDEAVRGVKAVLGRATRQAGLSPAPTPRGRTPPAP